MIRHIVMFRWKTSFTDEIRDSWVAGLENLRGKIPGLLALEHGPDVLKTSRSWDHVIIADFEDRAALEVYNTHPLHEAIKPFSLPNVEDLAYVDLDLNAGSPQELPGAHSSTHTDSPSLPRSSTTPVVGMSENTAPRDVRKQND